MDIQREIDLTYRFIERSKKFIEKVNETLNCEICYTARKNINYTCMHKVCISCYDKIKHCPFCRAPKPLKLNEYYYIGYWTILSEDAINNGIEPEKEIDYNLAMFKVICIYNEIKIKFSVCHNYDLFFLKITPKIILIGNIMNYPIFTLKADEELIRNNFMDYGKLDFQLNKVVLQNLIRKLNRIKISCLTFIEIVMEINELLKLGKELPL